MTSPNLNVVPRERSQAAAASGEPAGVIFVSVVIPVRNEEAYLGDVLEDLLHQDYPADRYEILVADGDSTDGTRQVVEHHARSSCPRVALFRNPGLLAGAGRNVGVRNSRGDAIVFVDGHCRILTSSFLRDTARILEASGADCLCRPQPQTAPGNTWFQDVVAHARASYIGHGHNSTIYATAYEGPVDPTSSGAVYLRTVFDCVGMYDENIDACEDLEFNHRVLQAGLRSYFTSRLAVYYHPRPSLWALFQQVVRYGRGRLRVMWKHPDAARFSQLIPAMFIAGLVLGGVGSLVSGLMRELLLLVLFAYAALLLGFSATLGLRYGWRHFVAAPIVYFTIHLGFGVGYWAGAFQACREKLRPESVSSRASAAPPKGLAKSAQCEKTVL